MSEYWKSTPKYWCKFCKIFVRDTTLEKKQHESTGKHQGNIQRSLRELHKNQGKEDREKQRAKDEVARLNGIVSGKPDTKATASSGPPQAVAKSKPHFTHAAPARATAEDRKRQAEQLAAMGVVVPDEFRKDMSIAGEWSTVSSTAVYARPPPTLKDEDEDEDDKDDVFGDGGQRKRKLRDEDVDVPEGSSTGKKRVWGSTLKAYPGSRGGDTPDFDSLLSSASGKEQVKVEPEIKPEPEELEGGIRLKKEESTDDQGGPIAEPSTAGTTVAAAPDAPVVFKKRKGKR